jgi:DNA-binding transcriptional regulator GbsR (MarR family)
MSTDPLRNPRAHFVAGISRIAQFWGFPKAMGATYAVVYLCPEPISLDAIAEAVGVTKGGLVAHLRSLERLGLVQRETRVGDRKDYYLASSDFWGIAKRILLEREKREFDRALASVGEALALLDKVKLRPENEAMVEFYRERLTAMRAFFLGLDRIVATVLAMDSFRQDLFDRLLGRTPRKGK